MRRVPSVIIDYIDLDAIVRLVYCNKTAVLMVQWKFIGLYCHVGIILWEKDGVGIWHCHMPAFATVKPIFGNNASMLTQEYLSFQPRNNFNSLLFKNLKNIEIWNSKYLRKIQDKFLIQLFHIITIINVMVVISSWWQCHHHYHHSHHHHHWQGGTARRLCEGLEGLGCALDHAGWIVWGWSWSSSL